MKEKKETKKWGVEYNLTASLVGAPRFYDDPYLAQLLPPDLFLTVAPATFNTSL
jgi:hypothetical protein